MPLSAFRWHTITESEFPWERDALDFVRERLPEQEPYQAWSNFEFIADDGSVNEVDLLVLGPGGFFVVEIKSRPGTLDGDAHTWTWRDQDREHILDNPLLLTNHKAKRLVSLLRRQKAVSKARLPFLEPLVFCSAPGLKVRLQGPAASGVRVRDKDSTSARLDAPGILGTLMRPPSMEGPSARIDSNLSRAIVRAMEQAGIKPSRRQRRVGDLELAELLLDGGVFQDYLARHVSLKNVTRRVRIYQIPRGAPPEHRRTAIRAAKREFQILEGVVHPAILRAVDYKEHERGPALVFEHQENALRLDHFLRQHGARLTFGDRLGLLRELAEAMQYAHDKRLVHRALSPQSVLVLDPELPRRRLQVFNWQVGALISASTTGLAATEHLGQLVDAESSVYLAPELITNPTDTGPYLDVFSLGAVTYHLFSGQPPAASIVELGSKLKESRGLQLSAAVDGTSEELQGLVALATNPDVSARLATIGEFLEYLELVEEKLTSSEPVIRINAAEATKGDRLPGGFVVLGRLGKGATAVALLVQDDQGRERVLKVATAIEQNDRLRAEGDVLRELPHQHIVRLHDVLDLDGRVGLLMDRAGETTLGARLRADGPLHLELLQRFGEDLLSTVSWLEQKGIPHRDIKPENIGVAKVGAQDRLHLVLFDFSLARTAREVIHAGTVPYLDPFIKLRKPPRWDLAAERFSAAVTLYEMATARTPVWGDGRSDPALIDGEAQLEAGAFDPDLREPMLAFFARALARDAARRFDNADDMLAAWRRLFDRVGDPRITTGHDDERGLSDEAIAQATRETPLAALGLSTRALNALERQQVLTAGQLVGLSSRRIYAMSGVGAKTRKEISAAIARLAGRIVAEETSAESVDPAGQGGDVVNLDLVAGRLLPKRGPTAEGAVVGVMAALLALGDTERHSEWPTQTDVASTLDVTRARVSQLMAQARQRWLKEPALTRVRDEVSSLLASQGGVMTPRELAQALLTMRGSDAPEPLRTSRALAVVRAAVEAERGREYPRFGDHRRSAVVLVAVDDATADYAERLGRVAERLAKQEPLLPPSRVLEEMAAVQVPEQARGMPPTRVVQLAAAASDGAAVSSRFELYPRGMAALSALQLAHGALLGARLLSVSDIRSRVAGRYPEAESLPDPPLLDDLLREAGLQLEWDPQALDRRGAYRPPKPPTIDISSSTAFRTVTDGGAIESTPENESRQRFEERLDYAVSSRSFVALTVNPRMMTSVARRLAERYPVRPVSVEALLIREMKRVAQSAGADWEVVRRADAAGAGGPEWRKLGGLVARAIPAVEAELMMSERLLLVVNPGMLARYGQLDVLEHLRDRAGRPDGPPGVWVLIPADEQRDRPVLDGRPVPVIGSSQWIRVPDVWISRDADNGGSSSS